MAVTGIGGFFFRSNDPKGLADWYLTHLGVGAPEKGWLPSRLQGWRWRPPTSSS